VSAADGVAGSRLAFLDGLRGAALVAMVVNHTARWWVDERMTVGRYALIYVTLTLAAPAFLFLVGFSLPLGRGADAGPSARLGTLARRLVPRGARIFAAGVVLNLLVFPGEPLLSGGVLQTIGLALAAMVPALWLLRFAWAPWVLLGVAAAGYALFATAQPALGRLVEAHPGVGLVLFYDFPPWPWVGLVLIGLVAGSAWLSVHRRSVEAGARWVMPTAVAGVALVGAFFAYDWWAGTPMPFGMRRDFILNRHWTPRPATLLWVFGILLLQLAAAYWVMERRGWRLRWLVVLGRTALVLYFLHQVLVFTLVREWLGWRFETWPRFWLANAALITLLVGCGWAWRALSSRLDRMRRPVQPSPG
jgi:uncharacterized membrane protein